MQVLLIEDDPVHRAFLREVIEVALPECTRLLEAEDGQIGERLFSQSPVDAVVMDLQMPCRTGVEPTCAGLRASCPRALLTATSSKPRRKSACVWRCGGCSSSSNA
jgi:CheY-like chemotaxis protein